MPYNNHIRNKNNVHIEVNLEDTYAMTLLHMFLK